MGRQAFAVEKPLAVVTTERSEAGSVGLGFHAFTNDIETQSVCELNRRLNDQSVLRVFCDLEDKLRIQFQLLFPKGKK